MRALLVSFLTLSAACASEAAPAPPAVEVSQECAPPAGPLPERIASPDGRFFLVVQGSDGGQKEIQLRSQVGDSLLSSFLLDPIDILWTPDSRGIVYAASPVYDTPGIYLRTLASPAIDSLVPALLVDSAYPTGADWLRVCSVDSVPNGILLRYARYGHVDEIDFAQLPPAEVVADTFLFTR